MGFLNLFTNLQKRSRNQSRTRALVDGDSLLDERGNGSRSRPGDQIMALKWLAELSNKEGLDISAVFAGTRLREVSEYDDYRGVDVRFSKDDAERQSLLVKLVKSNGAARSVVVTADEKLRTRIVSMGADSMRPSTLKKAGEASLGRSLRNRRSGRSGRSDRGERSERPDRPPRSRRPRRPNREPAPAAISEEDREILEFIDPL